MKHICAGGFVLLMEGRLRQHGSSPRSGFAQPKSRDRKLV